MTRQFAIVRVVSESLSLVAVSDGRQCHLGASPSMVDAFASDDPSIGEAFYAASEWGRKPRKSPPAGWSFCDVGDAIRLAAGVPLDAVAH
jgi:hypothetical protein